MDENDNKKRRNLMITSSAVVAALFLRLKIPSAAVGFLPIQTELVVEIWRVWVVILAILAYQTWRFVTDPSTKVDWSKATDFFTKRVGDYAPGSIGAAVRATIDGERRSRYQIELMGELPEANGFDLKRSLVGVRLQDSGGQLLPWDNWIRRTGECGVSYQLIEARGSRSWSSGISAKYTLPIWQPFLWYIRAAHSTLWHSTDCQDLFVPLVLAALAAGGSAARLVHLLGA